MKLLLLICLVLATSGINAYVTELTKILKLTQKVNQYVTECIADIGGDLETKKAAVRSIFSDVDDKNIEKVTHCFFRKAGILNADGKLNTDAAMSILTLIGMDKTEGEKLLDTCMSIAGYGANDTAYAVFKCFENGFKG